MQISKRDRILLIALAIFLALAAYYYFGIVPQEEKITELETELGMKEATKSEIDLKIASEFNLDKRIEEVEGLIVDISDQYFGILTQEEILMLVTGFGEGLSFNFSDVKLNENAGAEDSKLVQTMANLSFDGDYESLMSYLRNTRNFDKKVIVREVTLRNQLDQGLAGTLLLEFDGIPSVEAYSVPYKRLVTNQFNLRDLATGPFAPYDNFVVLQPTEPKADYVAVIDPNESYPGEPTSGSTPGSTTGGSVPATEYRPKAQIQGFEDTATFFVGSNADITGSISRSKTKVSGGYSADVTFDFITGREFSEANVVFDTTPVMIQKQADYLGLWVYAYESSNHAIGVVIIDSKGKEYRVKLTETVDWTQWNEIEAELPVEITYPCMVQRIYFEGNGYDQKLKGRYLLDQLQVSYPIQ